MRDILLLNLPMITISNFFFVVRFMKLEMTYMILHYNSWMSALAKAGILAGIYTLWLGMFWYKYSTEAYCSM